MLPPKLEGVSTVCPAHVAGELPVLRVASHRIAGARAERLVAGDVHLREAAWQVGPALDAVLLVQQFAAGRRRMSRVKKP